MVLDLHLLLYIAVVFRTANRIFHVIQSVGLMPTRTPESKQTLASQRVAAASPPVAFPRTMNSLVSQFSSTTATSQLKTAQKYLEQEEEEYGGSAMWGSAGGFGNIAAGVPSFQIPAVADVRIPTANLYIELTMF